MLARATRLFAILLGLAAAGCPDPSADLPDLLIRGGVIVDGTGAAPTRGDVAVKDGRILAVGELAAANGLPEIDATGLVIAPGFVDLHSHADLILLAEQGQQEALLEAKILQGVTTVLVGNCGLGVAPSDEPAREILSAVNGWMTPDGVQAEAWDTAAYLSRLERGGVVLNVATLVPHGPVRISAMGLESGRPTGEQLASMEQAVAAGMQAGAFGLSTGLIYPPGMFSDTSELQALASVVAEQDGLFTSHVRGSSETLVQATEELLQIARESGARVHHSHLEAVGRRFWPDVQRVLSLEDAARQEGLRVSHDVFPYTRAATMMSAIFPPWSLEGGVPELLKRLDDPEQRERIRDELKSRTPEWPPWKPGGWPHNLVGAVGWDGILLASVGPDGPTEWVGRSLADLAAELGRDPLDVVADLMIRQNGRVGQLVDEISGRGEEMDALLSILSHPSAAVISDAEDYGRGAPHPAHAGAFGRALRLGRDVLDQPLEQMVHRMTGYPASIIGLEDRGVIRPGARADLVLFDAETVTDRATWSDPRRHSAGISWVLINGTTVVEKGRYLGDSPGPSSGLLDPIPPGGIIAPGSPGGPDL